MVMNQVERVNYGNEQDPEALSTWRAIVGQLAYTPEERHRLAARIGVNPVTLLRWASSSPDEIGEKSSTPRKDSLIKLVNALPDYRQTLITSLMQEFPRLFTLSDFEQRKSWEPTEIPINCYEQVLQAAATLPAELRSTTVFDRLLEFALQQFDPERFGFSAIIVQCTPPLHAGEPVRSLKEQFRKGTPPWRMEREERNLFLGSESLAGHAVQTRKPFAIQDIGSYSGWLPLHLTEYEVSVAVFPIMRLREVAGCLLFSSTQHEYFTAERMALLEKYAHLALEAFDLEDFYEPQQIALRAMPPAEKQEPLLLLYPKRVRELQQRGKIHDRSEAARLALRALEDDLIFLAQNSQESREERPEA